MVGVETPCRESPVRGGPGYGAHRNQQALHRWVWEQVYGPIPAGLLIRHRCDNKPCFRLDHLELGTQADNMRDMMNRGRGRGQFAPQGRTHCPQGHPYDDENTYLDPRGCRQCRTCRRAASSRDYDKRRRS